MQSLVELRRAGRVESFHTGSIAIVSSSGRLLAFASDPQYETYLRSAAKPFQALPLLLAGGERRFALTAAEIALIVSSHNGEKFHTEAVQGLLARAGFGVADLECGAHFPYHAATADAMKARGEEATALHNNCSGKHAGMLMACLAKGYPTAGYTAADHPLQRDILAQVEQLTGMVPGSIPYGIDGCSVPTYFAPLYNMALAFARLAEGETPVDDASEEQRRARAIIADAMAAHPEMVAGSGRLTTDLMRLADGRLIAKEGAEGYYAMGVRRKASAPAFERCTQRNEVRAVGIALKMTDGDGRGRDPVILETLRQLGLLSDADRDSLDTYHHAPVVNRRGIVCGVLEADFRLRFL